MNRPEKIAWISLSLCFLCSICFLALLLFAGPAVASGMFGIMGFSGFLPFLYRKEGPPDERDQYILKQAHGTSYTIFWLLFVLVFMGIWSVSMMRGVTSISIQVLPISVFLGWITVFAVHALTTIILYRRGSGHAET